jgi:hypothetical protein
MEAMEQSYINGQVIKKQMVENRRKRKEMEEQINKQAKVHQTNKDAVIKKWDELKQTRLKRFAKETESLLKLQQEEKEKFAKEFENKTKNISKQQVCFLYCFFFYSTFV